MKNSAKTVVEKMFTAFGSGDIEKFVSDSLQKSFLSFRERQETKVKNN